MGREKEGELEGVVDKVLALLPRIEAAADTIDKDRRLPDALARDLKAAGAFRALIPARFGGLQTEYLDYLQAIKQLAAADASTAWCVNQAAVIALTSLWLPEETIDTIWSDPDTAVANGPPMDCVIGQTSEGWRLRGHWGFSSGCQHATWMMGAARCEQGGYRIAYMRPDQVQFEDTWQVAGLRGTGSFEFRVQNLHLAAAQVADMADPPTVECVMTTIPNTLVFATSFAAVALGIAEAALADVIDIAQDKIPKFRGTRVKDDPDAQRFIGKAQARLRAADAYLTTTVQTVLNAVAANNAISHDERAQLRMAGTHVIQECAEVVDLAYKVAGTTGIYQHHTLQRRYQDMHVITQHVQGRESYFALLGRYALTGHYEIGPMT